MGGREEASRPCERVKRSNFFARPRPKKSHVAASRRASPPSSQGAFAASHPHHCFSRLAPHSGSQGMASHSSTLIDASSSSDTLPSALRQLTRTQQVIHDILKTEPIDTEPLLPIMQMQARELPSNLDQPIRTCCFDMSSQPPAWSAHKVCQRCKEINRIVQGESDLLRVGD